MIAILSGPNNYLLRAELRRLIDDFAREQGGADADARTAALDMGLERLDGEEVSFGRMAEALTSLPFLASRKLVVLEQPGLVAQFAENAPKLLAGLPETTDLVIVEPKLDKRLAYYKFLKKQAGFREFGELDETGLAKWLVGLAGEQGAKLSQADARYLVERVGANQQTLAHEVEKLLLYAAGAGAALDRAAIDNLTVATPQSTIFQLLEAAFAGNTRRALQLYGEQRALKVEPQQIIAMLAWQLHVLALVKAAGAGGQRPGSRTSEAIAADAKISPYVVRKSAGIARSLNMARIRQLVADLLTIDERLKRESLDADEMLLEYLMRLAMEAAG